MRLYSRQYSEKGEPLIILHGLFGQQGNWASHARRLAADFAVYAFDARNHGQSDHAPLMNYPLMAADVLETMDALGIGTASFIGHSMGGKTAMQLALSQPERVSSLLIVDIAPVAYDTGPDKVLEALKALPLDELENRAEAEDLLAESISNKAVRDFLLTNLRRDSDGMFSWRMNLPVIAKSYADLRAAPSADKVYPGAALFVRGGNSDYILPAHEADMRALFPKAKVQTIEEAGHWVHSEQPEHFFSVARDFLLQPA